MPKDRRLSKDQLVEKLNGVLKLVNWQGKLLHEMLQEVEAGCVADDTSDAPAKRRKRAKASATLRSRARRHR